MRNGEARLRESRPYLAPHFTRHTLVYDAGANFESDQASVGGRLPLLTHEIKVEHNAVHDNDGRGFISIIGESVTWRHGTLLGINVHDSALIGSGEKFAKSNFCFTVVVCSRRSNILELGIYTGTRFISLTIKGLARVSIKNVVLSDDESNVVIRVMDGCNVLKCENVCVANGSVPAFWRPDFKPAKAYESKPIIDDTKVALHRFLSDWDDDSFNNTVIASRRKHTGTKCNYEEELRKWFLEYGEESELSQLSDETSAGLDVLKSDDDEIANACKMQLKAGMRFAMHIHFTDSLLTGMPVNRKMATAQCQQTLMVTKYIIGMQADLQEPDDYQCASARLEAGDQMIMEYQATGNVDYMALCSTDVILQLEKQQLMFDLKCYDECIEGDEEGGGRSSSQEECWNTKAQPASTPSA
jgi:hypothetical protein